ncbi:MAG: glycosyl transferase [Spirulinaceae cyanobacterium]
MSPPTLYIAITSHGFGHAVRASSVAAKVKQLCPDVLLILVTTAPRWLLESYIGADFIHRPRGFDVGVIQSDSLQMDKAATLAKMLEIKARQNAIIAGEVDFIRTNRVGLVLADIPPLAAPIAKAAGIQCWMMSNFGWDFIYRDWGEEFFPLADWIGECYRKCDRLFRLPLAEPMSAFSQITETGLTGGTPRYSEAYLREEFALKHPRDRTILLTFGGLGLAAIPYHNLKNFPEWQFITFDTQAPQLNNLVIVKDNQYRPVDFMPLCGKVISKPGYSTFAEAMRLDVPVVSLTREGFAESALLLEGLKNYSHHQIISPESFLLSDWSFIKESLNSPNKNVSLPKNGTETIAKAVIEQLLK